MTTEAFLIRAFSCHDHFHSADPTCLLWFRACIISLTYSFRETQSSKSAAVPIRGPSVPRPSVAINARNSAVTAGTAAAMSHSASVDAMPSAELFSPEFCDGEEG